LALATRSSAGSGRSATKDWDPIAEEAISQPSRTSLFNGDRLDGFPRKKAWLERYGIRHVMSTTYPLELLNITTFLSVYRGREPFSSRDLLLKQQLMPHLAQGMMTNWHRHLSHLASREVLPLVGTALVDTAGLIHCANASFAGLLRTRWPQWEGPYLPASWVEMVTTSGAPDRRAAASLQVEVCEAKGLLLVRLSNGSPLALLSAREQEVATAASLGKSYKEVASELGLAPATVRHYLGNAYAKLGVRNKAELTRVVSGASLPAAGHHLTIPSVTLKPPTSLEPPRSLARRSKVS